MIALLLAGGLLVQEPGIDLGAKCGVETCLITIPVLKGLVDSHNAMIDEIRTLRRLVRDADTICRIERRL